MRSIVLHLGLATVVTVAACALSSEPEVQVAREPQGSGSVPGPLAQRLAELAACQSRLQSTHATYPPQEIQAEGPPGTTNNPEPILYAYYLLDESGLDNPFVANIPGKTDQCELPANDAIGSVRAVLEPKPGEACDATNPASFIDIFTDLCGIIVINNESGWYEGWLQHFLRVPRVAGPENGQQPFSTISAADATILAAIGNGQNVPGAVFTVDGKAPRGDRHVGDDPSRFEPSNRIPIYVSLGAYNALQGEDAHSYWELNEYTNFSFPYYELFSTGGLLGFYQQGFQYSPLAPSPAHPLGIGPNADSRIPGAGPSGIPDVTLHNISVQGKVTFGDDPRLPRDADRTPETCSKSGQENPEQAEQRLRFIPSGLARQILIDAFLRRASFEPQVQDVTRRLYDAYAFEVSLVDTNGDGIIQFEEADIGEPQNRRLYLAPVDWERIIVTREINDGMLAPRYAPTEQAVVLNGPANFLNVTCTPPPG